MESSNNHTRVLTAAHVSDDLYQTIKREADLRGDKHSFFNTVILEYCEAWAKNEMPRVYVPPRASKSRTLYIDKYILGYINIIKEADNAPKSMIIRTAFAWYLYKHTANAGNNHDQFGTDDNCKEARSELLNAIRRHKTSAKP